jgi:CheY-like chemotaxis protein
VITGIDVAKAIREIPGLNTLLVAVTGYGDKTTRRRIAEAGFDHMVLKPCQFPELQRILTEAARRSEPEMSQ